MAKEKPKKRKGKGESVRRRACRKKPLVSGRRMAAAKMKAEGLSDDEIADRLGYADRSGARKAADAALRYEQYDDIRNNRLVANARLDRVRLRLLQLAGIADHESPNPAIMPTKPPPPPRPAAVAAGERAFTANESAEYEKLAKDREMKWRERCTDAGFSWEDGSRLTDAEPAQQVGACRALIALEKRRASMFGFDAPKHVIESTDRNIDDMDEEELYQHCLKYNIPIPPAMEDARRKAAGLPPLASAGNGAAAALDDHPAKPVLPAQ